MGAVHNAHAAAAYQRFDLVAGDHGSDTGVSSHEWLRVPVILACIGVLRKPRSSDLAHA